MGAATRNHRACRILICIRACGQRYSQRVTEIRFGYAPLIPTASPKPRFSVSGKPNFAVRDSRGQKWRCRSNVVAETQIDRGTVGELIGPEPHSFARSSPTSRQDNHGKQTPDDLDGCPTSSTTQSGATGDSPFVKSPRVVGRTRTMFHNTLALMRHKRRARCLVQLTPLVGSYGMSAA